MFVDSMRVIFLLVCFLFLLCQGKINNFRIIDLEEDEFALPHSGKSLFVVEFLFHSFFFLF